MSIIISNVSENYSREGVQKYEVRLNRILLSEFTHTSEDGMSECLIKAGESLKGLNIDEKIAEYNERMQYALMEFIWENS